MLLEGNRLQEYLRDEVRQSIIGHNLQLSEITEFYLVNLMTEFERSENLYIRQDGRLEEEPLAVMLSKAISGDTTTQIRELKHLGDTALYISGFFGEHVKKGPVDIDYYVDMGSGAYSSLAGFLSRQKTFGELYTELSEKFAQLALVLSDISISDHIKTNLDLLKIYERWLRSGDERLRQILVREGVILNP